MKYMKENKEGDDKKKERKKRRHGGLSSVWKCLQMTTNPSPCVEKGYLYYLEYLGRLAYYNVYKIITEIPLLNDQDFNCGLNILRLTISPKARLVSSCCAIFDLEPLPLSFDLVFSSEIFKSFPCLSLSSSSSCDLVSWPTCSYYASS
ncbi:hypothetical protein Tco_1078367 [Tanacetum coccineum]|uniref:Uncharacterized protein n=1 Tax=Tanacetum coccineum TaxID=301880 RepID=A0ABQ5HNS9_9ASTR